jgi:hypothetical protein
VRVRLHLPRLACPKSSLLIVHCGANPRKLGTAVRFDHDCLMPESRNHPTKYHRISIHTGRIVKNQGAIQPGIESLSRVAAPIKPCCPVLRVTQTAFAPIAASEVKLELPTGRASSNHARFAAHDRKVRRTPDYLQAVSPMGVSAWRSKPCSADREMP